MAARSVSLAFVGILAFTVSGCDALDDLADDIFGDGKGGTPAGPQGKPCTSSSDCLAGTFCTVESGVCNRPPGCGPNEICPAVCYGTCEPKPATGPACGPKTCAAGQVCCNESCGICTPPGGACTQQFCEDPKPSACKADSDCRTFSDYCTGCDCRALAQSQPDPVCPGPGVQCLVDPCDGQTAVCRSGQCALATRR
jgi:hypothetical protein